METTEKTVIAAPTSTEVAAKPAKAKKATKAKVPAVTRRAVLSGTQCAVRDGRELHRRLRLDFVDGIIGIAGAVKAAKVAAKKENIEFDSLFGDPSDKAKFSFTQNWANTIVRICDSGVLKGDLARIPADLNVLGTLASTPEAKRPEVLTRYYELREVVVVEGEVVKPLKPQAAMKKAKADIVDVTPKASKKKAPKNFDAARMARKLYVDLGDDGLSDLCDAIEALLVEKGVRS